MISNAFLRSTSLSLAIGAGLMAAGILGTGAQAQETGGSPAAFGAYFENDALGNDDRYYSSGARLGWSSAGRPAAVDLPLLNLLPFTQSDDYERTLLLTLGQSIYTPDNTRAVAPVPGDRPYAGWLFGGIGAAWKNERVRHSLMLTMGVVGSWALAEQTQQFFHQFNSGTARGWDNQLRNELGVIGSYEVTWRWPHELPRSGFGWELLPAAGFSAGNVLTAAHAGAEFRLGFNLPNDFGTAGITPASATSTPLGRSRGFGIYAFARADGSAVARNIFLDGNTFASSVSVDKEPLVANLSAGLAMQIENVRIACAFVYRTDEFETQLEPQKYGTISINWAF